MNCELCVRLASNFPSSPTLRQIEAGGLLQSSFRLPLFGALCPSCHGAEANEQIVQQKEVREWKGCGYLSGPSLIHM